MASPKLIEHFPISGVIECLTGLRIGGSKDEIEIGGMDNPVIRHPRNHFPYIPGSSLKGKMRSALEYKHGKVGNGGQPCGCCEDDCPVCRLFGPHMKPSHPLGPTRVLVRDAVMKVGENENPESWIEIKSENSIDRRTGIASGGTLRQTERVVEGAKFAFDISVRIFEYDNKAESVGRVREALQLIEKDYLGASGSRGYGKVKFHFTSPAEWGE